MNMNFAKTPDLPDDQKFALMKVCCINEQFFQIYLLNDNSTFIERIILKFFLLTVSASVTSTKVQ